MPYGMQTLWPEHSKIGTKGAEFHSDLDVNKAAAVIRKDMNPAIDSYSTFFENDRATPTGLTGLLCERGVTAVTLVRLVVDFCVHFLHLIPPSKVLTSVSCLTHAVPSPRKVPSNTR